MTEIDYRDINGVLPKAGDKIAYALGWSTGNAYMNTAVVKEIKITASQVKMVIEITKCGLYRYGNSGICKHDEGKEAQLRFPASHCKFIVL